MNIEEALKKKKKKKKKMVEKRVSHPSLNGVWITRCMNGKYYNNLGQEVDINTILDNVVPGEELYDNWFIVEGPRDRAYG